jgi:hypothetical protein
LILIHSVLFNDSTKANKKDIRNDLVGYKKRKVKLVEREQGESLAKSYGAFAFHETSAKTNEGVLSLFESATKASLTHLKSKRKKESNCSRCLLL